MAQSSSHGTWRLAILATVMGLATLAVQQVKPAVADDSPVEPPGARCCMGMAYFPPTNATYMYGGLDTQGGSQDDTWVWNGTSWSQVTTGANPGPRSSTRMVYDKKLDRIVLFGGQTCVAGLCDLADDATWFFDHRLPVSQRWQECVCLGDKPIKRTSEALGYHFDGEYVLLFGGVSGGKKNDTWKLVGTSVADANWDQLFPLTVPDGRGSAELAFLNKALPAQRQMVMFGGNVGGGAAPNNETWLWTGTNWELQSPPASPSARFGHRMEYDDMRRNIVIFGGCAADCATPTPILLNDIWYWNGNTWTLCGAGNGCNATPPLPRCCMGMAFDQARANMVMYAGAHSETPAAYPDTWLWDPILSWRCVHNCGL
jgi:hypothetical protein